VGFQDKERRRCFIKLLMARAACSAVSERLAPMMPIQRCPDSALVPGWDMLSGFSRLLEDAANQASSGSGTAHFWVRDP